MIHFVYHMVSRKVFLASDIFVAFVDRAHAKYLHAAAFFRYFSQEQHFLYTNIAVISDVYKEISTTISPLLAKEFIKALSLSSVNILYPEESDLKLTFKTLTNSPTTDLSFQEALIASMASRREIPYICTVGYLHPLFGLTAF